jgi:hypothetical protein
MLTKIFGTMKKHFGICAAFILCVQFYSYSQINYTANDFSHAPSYNAYFYYGTNGGWYGSSWDDKSLADIAAGNTSKNVKGAGSKTFRPPLPEDFLESWGYDIRLSEFAHYASLGVKDNTVILQTPTAAHRDLNSYGSCGQSMMFRNMYEPIWDGGANGTPVNDNNYYALYVYKTVSRYKNYVKFWEIMNEPDFDGSGNGYKERGAAGNWYDNDPNPCDLSNMRAPVYQYVRMLRISYEVIKSIDPTAFVATGGLGYVSFADAILRHTDNPTDGSVTAEYPLKGGAYFDVLSFHSYPMFNLATWSNVISGFVYSRHSDAAVQQYVNLKNSFSDQLESYGYDGSTYPRKLFICTENNIPRKSVFNYIGSEEAQKNYVIKALVEIQRIDVRQYYIFMLGDDKDVADATGYFETMGLYKNLTGIGPLANGGAYNQQYSSGGISYKTTSDLLMYHRFNAARTAQMNLPANIGGAAFTDSIGNNVYVLWAKTTTDLTELAAAVYSFPPEMNVTPMMNKYEWDYSVTNSTSSVPSINLVLTGTPIFLSESLSPLPIGDPGPRPDNVENAFQVSLYPNPAETVSSLKFTLQSPAQVTVKILNSQGQWVSTVVSSRSFGSGSHILPLPGVQTMATGVYYCSFETDKIKIIRKLLITH